LFSDHNFPTTNAGKTTKGSNDVEFFQVQIALLRLSLTVQSMWAK